ICPWILGEGQKVLTNNKEGGTAQVSEVLLQQILREGIGEVKGLQPEVRSVVNIIAGDTVVVIGISIYQSWLIGGVLWGPGIQDFGGLVLSHEGARKVHRSCLVEPIKIISYGIGEQGAQAKSFVAQPVGEATKEIRPCVSDHCLVKGVHYSIRHS